MLDTIEKTLLCCNAALSKKAGDVVALDLRGKSDVADIFVIASGTSRIQVQTIVNAVESALREVGEKKLHMEGYQSARWALIDAGDIVIHVFDEDTREFYGLERLWADAEPIDLNLAAPLVS